MVWARVIVLPDPVTPRRVWYLSPRRRPSVSSRIAFGWSPAGWNGATTSNLGLPMRRNIARAGDFLMMLSWELPTGDARLPGTATLSGIAQEETDGNGGPSTDHPGRDGHRRVRLAV